MRTRLFTVLIIAAGVLGCGSSTEPHGPTPAELCARQDSLVGGRLLTLDDDFLITARLLPGGFGGLTLGYMFLKDPARAESAHATARILADCAPEALRFIWELAATVSVRQGQYDWIELSGWRVELGGAPGMLASDIDESVNRLHFIFESQSSLDAFRAQVPSRGVPLDALVLTVEPPVVHERGNAKDSPGPQNDR